MALVADEDRLTYAELNARANRLAHHLRSHGVGPEVRVGLVLDDPLHRIVAVLGVLKAGGAYVPLEPSLPRPRLEGMLEAAGVSLVIVDRGAVGQVPRASETMIDLDADGASFALQSPEDLDVRVDGENLAYVIFTSGTTGRPKGVMVSHSALLAVAAAWESAYNLRRPPLRHLQAAGFGFDVFTGDWVRALTTGGTLVACPRPVLLDPAALADLISRERIECLELVPALADALAAHLERQGEDLDGVRLLAVGSDTVRGRLYRRLSRLVGPGGRVVNSYGLTETTIDSTYFGGPLEDSEGDGPVPIGRPMPGTRAYVLDGRGEPVPKGLIGELYIGGSGVARGYVADPRQTAERFMPDPYGAPGSRIYATGDLARWREGGVLELLGRRDGQVKVRGFRVELAEVEAALLAIPGSSRRRSWPGRMERRSAAHRLHRVEMAADPEVSIRSDDISARSCPGPMIPSAIVIVKALPRTPPARLIARAWRIPARKKRLGVEYVGASRRARSKACGDLGRSAPDPADRRDRRLLRPGRALAAGGPARAGSPRLWIDRLGQDGLAGADRRCDGGRSGARGAGGSRFEIDRTGAAMIVDPGSGRSGRSRPLFLVQSYRRRRSSHSSPPSSRR